MRRGGGSQKKGAQCFFLEKFDVGNARRLIGVRGGRRKTGSSVVEESLQAVGVRDRRGIVRLRSADASLRSR
jgi:hypothetical protein